MKTFEPKEILVPTDFSDLATHALEYAREIAVKFKSRLTLVYADPFLPPPYFTSGQVDAIAKEIQKSKRFAAEQLQSYATLHLGEAVAFQTLVVEGSPVASIQKAADDVNADLIAMGTHGMGGFNRVMLGSVTERVLRETNRRLLAVRAPEAQKETAEIRRILCPVNFSEVAHQSLDDALALGAALDAEVTVMHVVEGNHEEADDDGGEEIEQWVRSNPSCASVTFKKMVLRGNAPEQIISYAKQDGTDLIVIGAQHKRFFDTTILGSTTVSIIRHAPCPVLTVIRQPADNPVAVSAETVNAS